jgi:cytochrome b
MSNLKQSVVAASVLFIVFSVTTGDVPGSAVGAVIMGVLMLWGLEGTVKRKNGV